MTATVSTSSAIIKTLYPKGEIPAYVYQTTPALSMLTKQTDFTGENKVVAVQTETPQNMSVNVSYALAQGAPAKYSKFTVTRMSYYGAANVTGEAMKAVVKGEGGLVNLWKREIDQAMHGVALQLNTYVFGNTGGSLGVIGTLSGADVTLSTITDVTNFAIGQQLELSAGAPESGTLQSGYVTVSAINRSTGKITATANWTAGIATAAVGQYIVRRGDFQHGYAGFRAWVDGSASPGTLFGLSRNTDPVRLSGQAYDATGVSREDALVEAAARVGVEGDCGDVAFMHPRDAADMKKGLSGQVQYNRLNVKSPTAGVSFRGIEVEGSNNVIRVIEDRCCPRNKVFLLNMKNWCLHSLGPAPHIQDYDSNEFLRSSTADSYQLRIGFYGNQWCDGPVNQIRIDNFGL